jgi:diacylglycerol kinase family enzyme
MKNILIIINDKLNNTENLINNILNEIKDYENVNYSLLKTQSIEHLKSNYYTFKNFSGLFIVGGDGTISPIVQYLLNNNINIPIGCIPNGSGNGLVHSLYYNKKEVHIKNVIKTITNFNDTSINTMKIKFFEKENTDLYSFLFISYGIFSNIDIGTDYIRCIGNIRFTIGGIFELIKKNSFFGRLEYVKNKKWIIEEGEFLSFMANNASHTSSDSITSPLSKLNDNKIYLSYIKEPISRFELFNILNSLSDGTFVNYPSVKYFSTTEFKFYTNNTLLDIDGEYYKCQPIHVKIESESLKIYN